MFNFEDRVVLITGASGNLGQATLEAFKAAGARLALADRDTARCRARFPVDSDRIRVVGVDLLRAESVQEMIDDVVGQFGRIDIVCNIAGGFRMGDAVHELDDRTWDLMLNLNARSIVYVARAVVPVMLDQGGGKIVNVGANAATSGRKKMGAYIASKSAVIRLTETMAQELRADGINVNCVLPSTLDTPQNREAMPKANPDRWVKPADLAQVILFLASDLARAIHGAALPVVGLS